MKSLPEYNPGDIGMEGLISIVYARVDAPACPRRLLISAPIGVRAPLSGPRGVIKYPHKGESDTGRLVIIRDVEIIVNTVRCRDGRGVPK